MPQRSKRVEAIVSAALAEINRRRKLLTALGQMDSVLAETVCQVIPDEAGAAEWLVRPAFALGGKVPLALARTRRGRKAVVLLLMRIDRGIAL